MCHPIPASIAGIDSLLYHVRRRIPSSAGRQAPVASDLHRRNGSTAAGSGRRSFANEKVS
jgi:hypothetical protein